MHHQADRQLARPLKETGEFTPEELLGRIADRDPEALGTLYDKFSRRLLGLLTNILSSKTAAEQVLQDVFLRLWKEAPGIAQAEGSLAAWLVLMARHLALQRARAGRGAETRSAKSSGGKTRVAKRKTARKPGKLSPEESRGTLPAIPDSEVSAFLAGSPECWMPRPQDIALVDARMGLLHKTLDQMPQPQRQALDLAVFGGYTEAEIAERLGEPLGKVRAALRAAFTFVRHRQEAVLGTWTADI